MGLRAYPDSLTEDSQIDGIDAWGLSAIYRHFWTDSLRSSLAYSQSGLDSSGTANMTDSYDSAFINLMWTPITNTTLGIEYQRFELEEVDGDNFDLNRMQLSAKYDF